MQKMESERGEKKSPKEERVVVAAIDVFLRYGYARTTMRDIAESAGVSRPALYLIFPHKDDIFAAVLARLSARTLQEFRDALPQLSSLAEKLHFCCEKWGTHGFDLREVHPDSKDLFNPHFPPVREMYADFAAFLVEILTEPLAASELKSTPEALAQVLVFAMRGFEEFAEDGVQMRHLIAGHVDIVAAAIKR